MKEIFYYRRQMLPINYLIIIILVLGIFFRFVNLGEKIYWIDETFTSLRISGYRETELVREVSEKGIIGIKTLQKYQQINPDKTVLDTIWGVATEEPQLTPLYFVMARFWGGYFWHFCSGDSQFFCRD